MNFDKIICIGKNYLEHAIELGDPIPVKPVIFLKPPSILTAVPNWNETLSVSLPPKVDEADHEIEIVLRIRQGKIDAVTIGLDMTLRKEQAALKKNGHPWTIAKVFPNAAIIGPWISLAEFDNYLDIPFSIMVDGELRQQDHGANMRIKPEDLVSHISEFFPICDNDLIFTGTPKGVGSIRRGSVADVQFGKYRYSVKWY